MKTLIVRDYTVALSSKYKDIDPELLLRVMQVPPSETGSLLGGRGLVTFAHIPEIGEVVLKNYYRGGLLGKVNRDKYLRLSSPRPAHEYKILEKASALGVLVPEPVAWIVKGRVWYSGWLLMKRIPYVYSLAEYQRIPENEIQTLLTKLSKQIELLISGRIYHIDLHPGNVLVDAKQDVYLIDFDKARLFKGALNNLRDEYLCRWRRAILKHNLPDFLAEQVCASLRSNFSSRAI